MNTEKPAPLEIAERNAREVAKFIDDRCPPGYGFVLILASHGKNTDETGQDTGRMTYISNCQRAGIIGMLKEMVVKLESGEREV